MIDDNASAMGTVSCQSTSKEEILAALLDDYLSALERGAPLDLEQLVSEYPYLAGDLRTYTENLDVLHQVTQKLQGDQPENRSKQHDRRLGDFEIGPEIGRGGMGVVYESRQISLDRIVALKVLPFAAMWDEKQIARFRNEAQAAAQLHHPNIVPVFAVGHQRGVHFYAMQYIAGQSLGQAIRELQRDSESKQLAAMAHAADDDTALAATTERIARPTSTFSRQYMKNRTAYCRAVAQLGIQASEALHHAHEYGVLHRDIKPSNLLVDHLGKLWITDFGLARIQNSPGVTVTGDVVGTLRYMSPEQAAGEHALVDVRTDIYGLGATLYELLTLRAAFPGAERPLVLRAIETEEPCLPRSLNPDIPVDLETIVLQAMSKARDNRYGSAQLLAEDLNRFLEGKPTLARRPTAVDRLVKWLRRHRLVTLSAALVLALFASFSTVSAIWLTREKAEKETALVQSQRHLAQSQAHFQQARRVVDRFGIQLADQLQGTPGTERLRQKLLIETLGYYRGFMNQIGTDVDLQEQLAMTHLKAGVVTSKLGADKKAMDEYRTAQQILTELIKDNPDDPELQSQRALSRNNLALLLAQRGDTDRALAEYEQAIAAQQHLVATNPNNKSLAGHLAESHVNRGTLLGQLGNTEAAIQSLTHAVTILHGTCAAAPDNPRQARNLAIAYNNLSFVQRPIDPYLAEKSALRAVEILQQFSEAAGASDECRSDIALCYCNLAAIQGQDGRIAAAIESYHRVISLRESLVRKAPAVVRYRSELAASLNNLALLEIRSGDIASASKSFRAADQWFAALLVDYPDQISFASGWAALLNNQALALAGIGRYDDAIAAYQKAIEVQRKVVDQLGHCEPVKLALSRMVFNYGRVMHALGRWDEAYELASIRRKLWQGNSQRLLGVAAELAQLAQSSQDSSSPLDASAALDTLRQALAIRDKPPTDLTTDPRFVSLRNLPGFDALVHGARKANPRKGNSEEKTAH